MEIYKQKFKARRTFCLGQYLFKYIFLFLSSRTKTDNSDRQTGYFILENMTNTQEYIKLSAWNWTLSIYEGKKYQPFSQMSRQASQGN